MNFAKNIHHKIPHFLFFELAAPDASSTAGTDLPGNT